MQLVDIFLEPAKVFAAQKEKPTFLIPLLVFVLATVGMILAYFLRVDPAWYTDHILMMSGQSMTPAEIAQAKQFMPAASTQGYIGAASSLIFVPIVFCLVAVYYLLAGKIAGAAVSFKHGLALASWSSMPTVLGLLVGLVGALTMAPQTGQEQLMLTHLDPLLIKLPYDHALSGIAKGFDLLAFWAIGLGALGWKTITDGKWPGAIVVAALPSVIIYGVWLAIALT